MINLPNQTPGADGNYHIIIENVGGDKNGRLAYKIKNYYSQSDSNNFV
jgi:hypothetical protein